MIQDPSYFFDANYLNRFKNGDIPIEQVFQDLVDSITFFKRLADRATLGKAGLIKTTTDAHINNRDNNDENVGGVSPMGWTTGVTPAQIPKVYASPTSQVTVTPVRRIDNVDNTDTGRAVFDYEIAFSPGATSQFKWGVTSPVLSADTIQVGANVLDTSITSVVLNQTVNDTLETMLQRLTAQVNGLTAFVKDFVDYYKTQEEPVGTISFGALLPAQWASGTWIACDGASYLTASLPDLFAKIGYNYGGAGASFNVPNYVDGSYLQLSPTGTSITSPSYLGGNNSYTLTVLNIPQHSHGVGTLAASSTGSNHAHGVPINISQSTVAGTGTLPLASNDAAPLAIDVESTSTDGAHTHAITGSTGNYGTASPTAIPIVPMYARVTPMIKAIGYV